MARLLSTGFELNSISTDVYFRSATAPTVQSTNARSGTYAGRTPTNVSNPIAYGFQWRASAGTSNVYFRAYLSVQTLPANTQPIISVANGASFAMSTSNAHIRLTTAGKLQLFNGVTQIGSDSPALNTGTWYRVEIHYDSTPAGGSQVLDARIDGVSFASSSTLTLSVSSVLAIGFGSNLHGAVITATGSWDWDDIALNDTTGSFQNSWPSAGSIVYLRPNAVGDNTSWTSTGTNWSAVSEITPDDATSGNRAATAVNIDDYNIDATPTVLDSAATINCVQVGVRYAADTATQANNAQWMVRFKSSSGGTTVESAAIQAAATSYVTNANSTPPLFPLTLYQTPDSTSLTKSNLDTSQIGLDLAVSSSTSTVTRVTAMWLLVDYTPTTTTPIFPVISQPTVHYRPISGSY